MSNMMKLNLGCGKNIKEGYVNLDKYRLEGIDVIHDLNKFPYPFPNEQFDEIYASHVIEHLDDIPKVMDELYRILKPNGKLIIKVPYYNFDGAFGNPTHKHYFTPESFDFFTAKENKEDYYSKARFTIKKLILKPTKLGWFFPQFIRKHLGRVLGCVNSEIYVELRK